MKKNMQNESITSKVSEFVSDDISAIVRNIPDLVWIKDSEGRYLACNKRFEEFFGAKESDIIGKTDYDYVSLEQADFFRAKDQKALNSDHPQSNYEEVVFASDGHKEYLHVMKTKIDNKNGELIGILGIGRDFTKEKNIQDDLKRTLERLNLAINGTKDGVWDWDPNTNKVHYSDNWKRMLGYKPEEISDNIEEWSSRVHPEDIDNVMKTLNEHLEDKSDTYENVHRLKCKDGSWKWTLDRGKAQFDKDGKLTRVLGFHTDISTQKENEEKLASISKELEKDKIKYKTLMENSSEAIYILNEDSLIVEYSDQFRKLLGYSADEILNLYISDFEAVYTKEQIKEQISKHISYQPLVFESQFRKKDGSLIDVSNNVKKIMIEDQEYLYASSRDISNIKKYERELEEKQKRLELAQKSGSIGIWELDLETNLYSADDIALEIFGGADFEFTKESWRNRVDKEDLQRVEQTRKESILNNKPYLEEYKINCKDGNFKYLKVTGTVVYDSEKKPIKMIGTVVDNTVERVKNDKIKAQKEEFEAIFINSKDGIAIVDLQSRFLDCNDAYLEMLEYTKEELLTKSCIDLTVPEERDKSIEALKMGLKYGYLKNYEKTCIAKNGRKVKINMTASLLPDQKRFLMVTKDMTLTKLLDEQSKLAAMGEMIGNIAHQWRQPLSVISASASGLGLRIDYEDSVEKSTIKETTEKIVEQVEYLSDTIDDFRNFIKGGNVYKEISLKNALTKTFNLVAPSIKNNFISLKVDLGDDLLIIGNINEIQQALINIINNAKDALKENIKNDEDRFIFVSTKKLDENSLQLTIKDSGGGIAEDVINRIFEPYFTTKDEQTGTGIGLSMVDKIIREKHNGKISVSNEEYEYKHKHYKGAVFKIVFHSSK